MSKQLIVRPTASTATVEGLVGSVRRGQVRIPSFQRPLRWEATQVVALFDSIYKGYPIGSLLLQKKLAPAADVSLGPLRVVAPAVHDALWVIDGQQRLTSLAAGLARPVPVPTTPDDPFVVYFDAKTRVFQSPQRTGVVPSTWVPVAHLLDASGLMEWVFAWQHSQDADLRTAVFEVGTRLREYQVPLYTVETEEESVLRDIFYRTNTFGKVMAWEDVHKALFSQQGSYPSTLSELSEALLPKGMGALTEQQLLTALLAFEGLDPTRNLTEQARRGGDKELDKLKTSVPDALPVLGRVLDFLRNHAEIPHLRLLPRVLPLVVLTRYFRLFPHPSGRSLQLLVRWTWRVLTGLALFDERTLLRRGVGGLAAGNDEEQAQALLRLVPNQVPEQLQYRLPARFDARAAESRLALWALYQQTPLGPDLQPVALDEIAGFAVPDEGTRKSLPVLFPTGRLSAESQPLAFGPANRALLPDGRGLRLQTSATDWAKDGAFWASHLVDAAMLAAYQAHGLAAFLVLRGAEIERLVRLHTSRLAAWGQPDRVSIGALVTQTLELETP